MPRDRFSTPKATASGPRDSQTSPKSVSGTTTSLPGSLTGASLLETLKLQDVPSADALSAWLERQGIPNTDWGKGETKSVDKLWKEVKLAEANLELWSLKDGGTQVLRATHVLRGKVCSAKSRDRNLFLFNTWQQYADGRKRTRNALLSEKLSTSEIPLEDNLHEVCKRAMAEEMHEVVEAEFAIGPSVPPPQFNPNYRSPIKVEREHFVDYTVEIESSKSFPGLLTVYHLYTVDIVCSGLPDVDFNTLEFAPPNDGRGLKYVHAWNWLDWSMIRRYLFEGSTLKERKKRGSFEIEEELEDWLEDVGVDTSHWGEQGFKSVGDLWREVQAEEAHLELWGRQDGVPLLMRVVHVLQLKIVSEDHRLADKFLFQAWQQSPDGRARSINRLMSKKLSCAQVPFDESRFTETALTAVNAQLTCLADVHFQLNPAKKPAPEEFPASDFEVKSQRFVGHHYDLEESPSFKGMQTMYHLYTMELQCEGLPSTDFTSIDFGRKGGPHASGWRWMTLPGALDVMHSYGRALERQEADRRKKLKEHCRAVAKGGERVSRLLVMTRRLEARNAITEEAHGFRNELEALSSGLRKAHEAATQEEDVLFTRVLQSTADTLPPAMLSKMSTDVIAEEAMLMQPTESHRDPSSRAGTADSQIILRNIRESVRPSPGQLVLGTAMGLCIGQFVASSLAVRRAKAARSGELFAWSQLVGALGMGLLLTAEMSARRRARAFSDDGESRAGPSPSECRPGRE